MNIEEKTKMAHEYAMKHLENSKGNITIESLKSFAWQYADAMEVEAEKRIKAKAEKGVEDAKVFFEKLTRNEDGSCNHIHTTLNGGKCFDCGEKLTTVDSPQLEFQVDWSVAPEWATHFFCEIDDLNNSLHGFFVEGSSNIKANESINGFTGYRRLKSTTTFNYKGDWKDSLRKRP